MAYVNPMQFNPSMDPFGAAERGFSMADLLRKRRFGREMDTQAKGFDITSPEGQVMLLQALSQAGYGREVADLQKPHFDPQSREQQQGYRRAEDFRRLMGPYGDPMAGMEVEEAPSGRFASQPPQGQGRFQNEPMPGQPGGTQDLRADWLKGLMGLFGGGQQPQGGGFQMTPMPLPQGGNQGFQAQPMPNGSGMGGSMQPMPLPDPSMAAPIDRSMQGIPEVAPDAGQALPEQGVGGGDSTRLMGEAVSRFLAGQQPPQAAQRPGMDDDRLAWEAVRHGQMSVGDYLQQKRLRETKANGKDVDPFDDPAKYQAYLAVAQTDPEFQAINKELATNRAKAGPKLTQWAIKHGYAGQKWWDREFGNLTKEAAKGPSRTDVAAAQNVHTNIRNARKDFEDNDFVKMIPKTDRYFQSASKAFTDYETAPDNQKGGKRQFMDQALVYSFNKLMEETSAVMPGEFERTAMGQSVPEAVINKIRSGLGGGLKLDDNQRRAMLNTMKIFRDGVIDNAKPAFSQFENEARILSPDDPDRILGGYKKYFGPSTSLAASGTVWRRAKDGKEYEYNAATRKPTGGVR